MTGLRTCPDCDGEGITECTACSKRQTASFTGGYKWNPFGCMVCGNTLDVPCPTCNGTGYQGFSLKSAAASHDEAEKNG